MVYATTPLSEEIRAAVMRHWSVALTGDAERLHGGEESAAWRIHAHVVRIGPAWRSLAELEWCHAIAAHAAAALPEALAPLPALSGATVTRIAGRPVSLWPYRAGAWGERETPELCRQAAGLLARLHRALRECSMPPRPGPGPTLADAPELADPDLDRWLHAFDAARPARQPLHGDFYPGNVLIADDRICGLLDWDDALLGPPERELAWAAWEWGDGLWQSDLEGVLEFTAAYRRSGGVARPLSEAALRQLVRERLRYEIRRSRALRVGGAPHDAGDLAYERRQVELFVRLRPSRGAGEA